MNIKRILLILTICLAPLVSALGAGNVLMVVSNPTTPTANDAAMRTRLQAFGFTTTLVLDSASTTADASGKVMVLISASVASGNVSTKFRDVTIPVLVTERAVQDEMLMTLDQPTGHGQAAAGQTDIIIVDSAHPLAGGLPSGEVTVASAPNDTFNWGEPSTNAHVVATVADGSGHSCIYGYTNGAVMIDGTTHAPARRVFLYQGDNGLATANSNGVALFDAAVAWSLSVSSLGTPPTVTLTQPANGATFAAGANISLQATASDVETSVSRVEFYAGTNKLGQSTSGSPFSFTWTNAPTGRYNMTARAYDTSGAMGISSPVIIVVGTPPPQVVMVVGDPNGLNGGEVGLQARLVSFGYGVVLVDDNACSTNDAIGTALVIISSTIDSGTVGTTYRTVAVPVINWENGLQDDLLMTGPLPNTDFGTTANYSETNIDIVGSGPLVAGLSAGVHMVTTSPDNFTWGDPGATDGLGGGGLGTYMVVATLDDGSGLPCVYTYDAGALLWDGVTHAPARRIQLFLNDDTYAVLTSDGVKLVDNALAWALNVTLGAPPTVSLTSPTNGSTFAANANITLTATASDSDGTVTNVEFYVDGALVGHDTTSPYSFAWNSVPAGIYHISAKATDNSGYSSISASSAIVVGEPPSHILCIVGNATSPNISDQLMIQHLQSAGFVVTTVGDASSTTSDTIGQKLIVISASVTSGNIGNRFQTTALPVLNMDSGLDDNFLMALNTTNDEGDLYAQTQIEITNSAHPLAAGLTNGFYTVNTTPDRYMSWAVPTNTATIIAITPDTNDFPVIFGYDKGAALIDGTPAPERRVHFFPGDNSFTVLNPTGLKLFDAAVNWAFPMQPKFNPPTAQPGNITVSWVGFGKLESAANPAGPWTAIPGATTPFTTNRVGSALFFRINQSQ